MNKVTRILLAIGLILAVAAPAFAEFKLTGLYRNIGYVEEKKSTIDDNGDSQQFIDQRMRMRANWSLNDNVSLVYFAEIDTTWGENNKAAVGQGGMSNLRTGGADGVNVETKNAYLDLKFGDTGLALGIQGVADAFQSIVVNDDMAAVQATHKIGGTALKFVYSKWDEDIFTGSADTRSDWDDMDFWAAEVKQKFSDNFTLGGGVYLVDDNDANNLDTATSEVWFYGLNADAKFDKVGLSGFAVLQDGEYDAVASGADYDFFGWAASAKLTLKLEKGDIGLRVIYFTDDDDDKDNGRWQGFKGEYAFVSENQMQFLVDPYVMNDTKEQYAIADAVYQGYGLMAAVLSGNHNLPEDFYVKWGVGYYRAVSDERDDESNASREGKTLGYEVAARVGKKIFEKVDVSLNGSYADYGSFYDDSVDTNGTAAGGKDDPDATYKTYLMVNVPF